MAIPNTTSNTARLATIATVVDSLLARGETRIAMQVAQFEAVDDIAQDIWENAEAADIDDAINDLVVADVIRATYAQGRAYAAYADPTESARARVGLDQALAIASEDPSLLVLLPR